MQKPLSPTSASTASTASKCDADAPQLVALGHIMGAFGVQGMVKIQPYAADSALPSIDSWWLSPRQVATQGAHQAKASHGAQGITSAHQRVHVKACRWHGNYLIASFPGVADRDQAQALKGRVISVDRRDFPAEDEGEYYWVDLVGCWVYDDHEVLIGQVVAVSDNGVHAVLHVDRYVAGTSVVPSESSALSASAASVDGTPQPLLTAKGKPRQSLIPFVEVHVLTVDISAKRIVVDWPLDF